MMKRSFFMEHDLKKIMKKAVSIACMSAILASGVPSGIVFAADGASDAPALIATQEDSTLPHAAEDCMQKIFEHMTKEDSDWNKGLQTVKEYYGDSEGYRVNLNGNTITISTPNGSWNYTLEGDYLTYSFTDDPSGYGFMYFDAYVMGALIDYLGMDRDFVNGYVNAVIAKNIENKYVILEQDAEDNPTKFLLYAGGTYQMDDVLNSVWLDEDILSTVDPLSEDSISAVSTDGKFKRYHEGTKNSVDIYIGEHDELTELSYKSIIALVKKLQPAGYEKFVENYKELSEVSTDTYQVSFVNDNAELPESLQSENQHYKYIKIHFSTPGLSKTSMSMKAGEFDFTMPAECEVKSWSSSNKKIATVSDGQIMALKKGTVTITAKTTTGKTLTCKVTVTSSPTVKIGGKKYTKNKVYTVKKGKTIKAVITGKASSVDTALTSSNKKIAKATADASGETVKIKGLKKGTSKIAIKVNGVSFLFKVKVN